MGMKTAGEKNYSTAIRQLFPMGEYWEKQFANPESDVNLFCEAKSREIILFKKRMIDLLAESKSGTSVETIGDWERIFIGHQNINLTLFERRNMLETNRVSQVNKIVISAVAEIYGFKLIDIIFPFKASFFGFSKFGASVFSRPAFFSVFYIVAEFQDDEIKNTAKERIVNLDASSFEQSYPGCYEGRFFSGIKQFDDFEQTVKNRLIAGSVVYFQYKLENFDV